MEIKDALDIMNSDFKLWEKSKSKDLGNGKVEKTIDLPWGIGEYSVTLEGMNDGSKRRAAVGAYGQHIRDLIKERIDDEAITSRAKAAAARAEYTRSSDSNSISTDEGLRDSPVQTQVVSTTSEAYSEDAEADVDFGEALVAKRVKIDNEIERLTANLAKLCKELRGIDAAIEAMRDEEHP